MPFLPADWVSTMRPAIWNWVSGVLGVGWTVIWSQQSAPAPALPYAILDIVSPPTAIGRPSVAQVDNVTTLIERIEGDAEFTLSITLLSVDDSQPQIQALEMSRYSQLVIDALYAAGLAVRRCLSTREVDAVAGAQWETRPVIDFAVGARVRIDNPQTDWMDPDLLLGTITTSGDEVSGVLGG